MEFLHNTARAQEGREGKKRRKTPNGYKGGEEAKEGERFSSIFMAPPSDDQNRNKREDEYLLLDARGIRS